MELDHIDYTTDTKDLIRTLNNRLDTIAMEFNFVQSSTGQREIEGGVESENTRGSTSRRVNGKNFKFGVTDVTTVGLNTIFVDSVDGLLKFKDISGVVGTITIV